VKRTYQAHACVECHLIGDFQNLHREQDGTLDKLVHLFRSPDLRTIGIHLDVPKGLVIKETEGAAAAAGLKSGDRITKVEGTTVYTFGDLQYRYDKVPRTAKSVQFTVDRAGANVDTTVEFPVRWWFTDTRWRQSSVEPRYYFDDRPLTAEEKGKYGLPPDGLASYVKYVSALAQSIQAHDLKTGDIIVSVDGKSQDAQANTASLYLILYKSPGDTAELEVLRDGQRLKMKAKSVRMSFRK
jgi:S1-C subfamily serine protease